MKSQGSVSKIVMLLLVLVITFSGFTLLLSGHSTLYSGANAETKAEVSQTLRYKDGSKYQGDVFDKIHRYGTGKYTWKTGEVYTGTWKKDVITGQGKLTLPKLGSYVGDFLQGKRQGQGTFTWTYKGQPKRGDPVSFEGNWKDDTVGSSGTLVLSGIGTYKGKFKNKVREGEGTFTWLNGDTYSGNWTNDKINGQGTLKLSNGTTFKGQFTNGRFTEGSIAYKINNGKLTRSVSKGKVSKTVKITLKDKSVLTGEFSGKQLSGDVTIKYASGDKYVGRIINGLREGQGTYTWKNGAHYVGQWSKDKMSGTGKYYYSKNEKDYYLTGNFKNGVPNGRLTYMYDRKKYITTWENGACTKVVRQK